MSQGQPERPYADQFPDQEPIKYGDVFNVYGELASKPILPQDAATMQAAENILLGETPKGGVAAVMQSAATLNEQAGLVSRSQVTKIADEGVTISDTNIDGNRVITEAVGGQTQVVGQYVTPEPVYMTSPTSALDPDAITIGEALEATALSAGEKPVDQTDAAAIQAAEVRATGRNITIPGGVAAKAQSAASLNARIMSDDSKTKLSDVLTDAKSKLSDDKAVTREDAKGVTGTEIKNNLTMSTTPGGVAESMVTAARLNQNK